jgi:uncharacterized cupredoxin-like copper-binding protein
MGRLNRTLKPGRTLALIAAGALVVVVGAGCSSSGSTSSSKTTSNDASSTTRLIGKSMLPTTKAALPTFEIDAEMPYKFVLPEATAPSGYVQIKLVNKDTSMEHQAQLVKLRDGVSFAKFKSDLTGPVGDAAMMMDGTPSGGPNAIGPGGSDTSITNLAPGATYAVVCNIPAPDGKSHAAHGMITSFTVSTKPGVTNAPGAASTIKLIDFAFGVPKDVDWTKPIKMENQGKQAHEMAILAAAPGKTLADVQKALKTPPGTAPAGPPPYEVVGGIAAIAPGGSQVFQPKLKAGKYLLVCFIPDSAPPHLPHFMKGMMTEVDVS